MGPWGFDSPAYPSARGIMGRDGTGKGAGKETMCDFLETVETSAQGRREAEAYAWGAAYRAANRKTFDLGGAASGIRAGRVIRAAAHDARNALVFEALRDDTGDGSTRTVRTAHALRIHHAFGHGAHGDTFDTLSPCDCGECYWNRQEA